MHTALHGRATVLRGGGGGERGGEGEGGRLCSFVKTGPDSTYYFRGYECRNCTQATVSSSNIKILQDKNAMQGSENVYFMLLRWPVAIRKGMNASSAKEASKSRVDR